MEPWKASLARRDGRAVSPFRLGWVFLHIGAVAFGGLGAALALVERELVTKRQWLTAADVTEALTYTKLLPGSTVVQLVAYLGYTLGGWSGSAVATHRGIFRSSGLASASWGESRFSAAQSTSPSHILPTRMSGV